MLEPHNPRLSISRSCIIEAHGGARACILDLAMHDEGDVLHVTTSQSVALGRLGLGLGLGLGLRLGVGLGLGLAMCSM